MKTRRLFGAALALPLAAFFAFVGWNKAFAPLADLARYHAWTVFLPEWLGRVVGWSEMMLAAGLCAALLASGRNAARVAALVLVFNQIAAAFVHANHGETSALPQNAVLITLLGAVALLLRPQAPNQIKEERSL